MFPNFLSVLFFLKIMTTLKSIAKLSGVFFQLGWFYHNTYL